MCLTTIAAEFHQEIRLAILSTVERLKHPDSLIFTTAIDALVSLCVCGLHRLLLL